MKSVFAIMTLAASLALTPMASAAGYIKFDGIEGESKDSRRSGWINIDRVTEGYSRPSPAGAASGRMRASLSTSGLTFEKEIDATSPLLRRAITRGESFKEVSVDLTESRGGQPYMTIKLTSVTLTDLNASMDDGEASETITLNYESIEWTYPKADAGGRSSGDVTASYNFMTGR
ncbi:MAG: hypothetical protein CMK09_16120 [Ponticaulis sp.]|nr:hypothetical protein [Ponticaulis sp.]|tara:strand:+ start:44130 stop:44654 length:525 start_codon:yes stop_codon:yes gene_type:complete